MQKLNTDSLAKLVSLVFLSKARSNQYLEVDKSYIWFPYDADKMAVQICSDMEMLLISRIGLNFVVNEGPNNTEASLRVRIRFGITRKFTRYRRKTQAKAKKLAKYNEKVAKYKAHYHSISGNF